MLTVQKNITIDLGGKTLSRGGSILDIYSNVTLKNGTISIPSSEGTTGAVWVNKTAHLDVAQDVVIQVPDKSFDIAFWKDCTTAEVTVKGTLRGGNGVTMNGEIGENTANKLTVDGAKIEVSGHGIYQAGCADTNFNNSVITAGCTGIEVRAGSLTVDSSTIAGGNTFECKANGSGTTTDGAGIAIAQHTTKAPIDVKINGGKISGAKAVYESNPQNNDSESIDKVKLSITGGEFDGAIESKDLGGFVVGGTFSDIAGAMKYAAGGATLKMGTNVNLGKSTLVIPANKKITLDLAGKTLESSTTTILNNGSLVVKGTNGGLIKSTGNVGIGAGDNSNTVVESGNIEAVEGAIITSKSVGATITVNGGVFSASDNSVIAGNGSEKNGNVERTTPNTININGGTFNGAIKTDGYVACGIYAPWKDTINVNGGVFNITGGAGIVARAGQVNISGGTFNVTGEATGKVGDSRIVVPCSALVFDEQAAYPGLDSDSAINVTGGAFVSGADVITTVPKSEGAIKRIKVSAGTFSSDASAYMDKGACYEYKMNDGKTFIVQSMDAAAPANSAGYNTWGAADANGIRSEEYVAPAAPVIPTPTPKPEPAPEPTPAAPGTAVSGTDNAGNKVDATVTDNTATTLPDGTTTAGSVEYKGSETTGSAATEASVPSTVTTSDGSTYVVTKIADEAFEGQKQLTKVTIPGTIVEIGDKAFAGTSIEEVKIPAATTTIGDGVFQGCDSLKDVDLSASAITEVPADAFNGTALKAVEIPATVTTIGARAFKDTALKNVSTDAATVAKSAFAGCESLKSASLPKVTEIGKYAFNGAGKLKSLTTGKKLEVIGYKALAGTKVGTLTVSSKKLTKGSVKGSLKGSNVKKVVVDVSGSKKTVAKTVEKYKQFFTKKNCGKSVKVVAKKK